MDKIGIDYPLDARDRDVEGARNEPFYIISKRRFLFFKRKRAQSFPNVSLPQRPEEDGENIIVAMLRDPIDPNVQSLPSMQELLNYSGDLGKTDNNLVSLFSTQMIETNKNEIGEFYGIESEADIGAIIDEFQTHIGDAVTVLLRSVEPRLASIMEILINLGFRDTRYVDGVVSMTRAYTTPDIWTVQASKNTLHAIETGGRVNFKFSLPKRLASLLSRFTRYKNEMFGSLLVAAYDERGFAILDAPPASIIFGEEAQTPSDGLYPMSFHTHQGNLFKKADIFVAWPSGIDVGVFAERFYLEHVANLIMHMVATEEGIWIMVPTLAFSDFVTKYDHGCARALRAATIETYAEFELHRLREWYDPLHHDAVVNEYIKGFNSLTLGDIVEHSPDLGVSCNLDQRDLSSVMYNIDLIKWKTFYDLPDGGALDLNIDYTVIPEKRTPVFLPVEYQVASMADLINR